MSEGKMKDLENREERSDSVDIKRIPIISLLTSVFLAVKAKLCVGFKEIRNIVVIRNSKPSVHIIKCA